MKVLVDTNIILDFLLEREPFFTDADTLIQTIRADQIQGYLTATTLTDIFYIARKPKGVQIAKQYISDLLALMRICPVNKRILNVAISSNLPDFEDAVQLACAMALNLDAIVTRDTQGFAGATLPILSAGEVLQLLSENLEESN
jgi:predicted nucleic acid-binding protein